MNTEAKSRSISATSQGLKKVKDRMKDLERPDNQDKKGWTQEILADKSFLSLSTIKRFMKRESIDESSILSIAKALNLDILEIVDPKEWNQDNNLEIDWLQVCHTKLEDQQKQIRKNASAMRFELDFPPVPLGLVEHKDKEKQQPRGDDNQEKKPKIYEHNDFLEQVINQNPAGKNKHIAIVGEPGAGKTTLLSAIASYIKNENKELPIVISLGSLQGMTLEEYILKKWLPDTMRLVDITPTSEIEEQLKTRFYKGGVWLLLDGVDEMGESSPTATLNKMSQVLTDWLGKARVVLTCRLNVWDANPLYNDLSGFDTYKTQEFKPEQIDQFIEKWFKCDDDKIQRGEELKAKLREPGKERIRELVTNPLRLCLLCQIFYQNKHGELPETKAGLFDLYANNLYGWKPQFITQTLNYTLKQELHKALGRLALAGIERNTRFRLNESLAVKEMGQDLFDLACHVGVGWLTLVDRDANNNEAIYAFFHPNFQEYFAALVIDDWHYFLNHNNANPNPFIKHNNQDCVYRIFEGKWKEVFLLWLGSNSVDENKKEALIYELGTFEDGCGSIYQYKAYYLAATGFKEFKSKFAEQFISWLINVGFGYLYSDTQEWQIDHSNIAGIARKILLETDGDLATNFLIKQIRNTTNGGIHRICAWGLGQIGKYNSEAIDTLISLIYTSTKNATQYQISSSHYPAIESLGNIAKENQEAIYVLRNLISTMTDNLTKVLAATSLAKISSDYKSEATETLLKIMSYNHNDSSSCQAAYNLAKLDHNYFNEAIKNLIHMQKSENSFVVRKSNIFLLELMPNNSNIEIQNHLLEINSEYPDTVEELINVICNYTEHINLEACYSASDKLVEILTNNEDFKTVVQSLKDKLSPDIEEQDYTLYYNCYEVVWHCAQNMTYPEFYSTWHGELKNLENQFTDTHSHLSQLQPTEKTHPLTLNLKTLQNETDIIEISQEICNQIYFTACPENPEIPQVNSAPQLKSKIPQIKKHLQTENIALIINNCEPNQEMIKFCNKLTDVLHIAFITEQPLDAPLKGFPNQPNLLNIIQHWINEIG
jgi:DNA replication protein DnaC